MGRSIPEGDRSADEEVDILRIECLLARAGRAPDEQQFRARRFHYMMRFISLHEFAFNKAGFFVADDGNRQAVSKPVLRAVHETSHGGSLRHSDKEPIGPVVERAQGYLPNPGRE